MLEKIGKYEIDEKIGSGGFGHVFRGRDPFIKRVVAVKTCLSDDEDIKKRFFLEAEYAGNLHHRNIVTIYDFGIHEGTPYIVQEFLTGEDLDRSIKRKEKLSTPRLLDILVQVAEALSFAHQADIVHRDVKPANIRILPDGVVKVMDFGIAKSMASQSDLTQTGITLGTAAYLAPEQIRGEPIDQRTDIFAFGVMMYELFLHTRPFQGEHITTVLYKILNEDPKPAIEINPDVPLPVSEIIQKCVKKDLSQRYSTMLDVRQELARVFHEMGGHDLLRTHSMTLPTIPMARPTEAISPQARTSMTSAEELTTATPSSGVTMATPSAGITMGTPSDGLTIRTPTSGLKRPVELTAPTPTRDQAWVPESTAPVDTLAPSASVHAAGPTNPSASTRAPFDDLELAHAAIDEAESKTSRALPVILLLLGIGLLGGGWFFRDKILPPTSDPTPAVEVAAATPPEDAIPSPAPPAQDSTPAATTLTPREAPPAAVEPPPVAPSPDEIEPVEPRPEQEEPAPPPVVDEPEPKPRPEKPEPAEVLVPEIVRSPPVIVEIEPEPAPAPREKPKPLMVDFEITSNFPSTVYLDGRKIGEESVSHEARAFPGQHEIRWVIEGYDEFSRKFEIEPLIGNVIRYEFPPWGKLTVTQQLGTPAGEVFIDKIPRGRTPVVDIKISAGEHLLEVTQEGYAPVRRTIRVEARKSQSETIALQKKP